MGEFESERAAGPRRTVLVANRVLFAAALTAPAVVPPVALPSSIIQDAFAVESPTVWGAAVVAGVLAEAIALYVGYGAVAALLEPSVRDVLGGDEACRSPD